MKNTTNKIKIVFLAFLLGGLVLITSIIANELKLQEKPINEPDQTEEAAKYPFPKPKDEKPHTLPDFTEKIKNNETDAVFQELGALGALTDVEYSYDKELPNYYITKIDAKKGSLVKENQHIKVTVNINEEWQEAQAEKEKETIAVPYMIGSRMDEAMEKLSKSDLKNVSFEEVWSDDFPDKATGSVVNQSDIGTMITPEDKAIYYIYMGTLEDKKAFDEAYKTNQDGEVTIKDSDIPAVCNFDAD